VVHSAGLALWGLTNQQVPARRRGSGSRALLLRFDGCWASRPLSV